MTVAEIMDFFEKCSDNDVVTLCALKDDNPLTENCDIGKIYRIEDSTKEVACICIVPN